MAARACIFALVSLLGTVGSLEFSPHLIVWNVGQGQWLTIVDSEACWHIDMGGEFAPWRKIVAECRSRPNRIALSHWDWDHISFIGSARYQLPNLCVLHAPEGRSSPRKEAMVRALPVCGAKSPLYMWADFIGRSANAQSRVIAWRGVLAPGDSPRTEERRWVGKIPSLERTKILVLGHHGSRTSTSEILLSALPKLLVAVASQRHRRYGHPHIEVIELLRRYRVPLLLTEEWGTIRIPL